MFVTNKLKNYWTDFKILSPLEFYIISAVYIYSGIGGIYNIW